MGMTQLPAERDLALYETSQGSQNIYTRQQMRHNFRETLELQLEAKRDIKGHLKYHQTPICGHRIKPQFEEQLFNFCGKQKQRRKVSVGGTVENNVWPSYKSSRKKPKSHKLNAILFMSYGTFLSGGAELDSCFSFNSLKNT